jgi:uncharacterized protein YgiB involved in biofilm formation
MEDRGSSPNHEPADDVAVALHSATPLAAQAQRAAQTPRRDESNRSQSGRARKRSAHLTLVFISAAAAAGLAGCGRLENSAATSRDVYANLEECRADWGNPEDCEEIDEKRSATGTRSYYGPRYSSRTGNYNSGYSTTTRPGSRSKGTVSSTPTRGGFGSSSSRHGGSSHSSSG